MSDMDPNFEDRLTDFKKAAKQEYDERHTGGQAKWCRPEDWDTDVFDLDSLHRPFDGDKSNKDLKEALSTPDSGKTGDIVASTTMIDTLSAMERAFHMRHAMRKPRAMAHMLGRKKGHGDDMGPLIKCALEHVRVLLKQAKTP